ncbi:hypothetical protein CGH92_24230 [Vibrio parahaemolyticus]|uniref:hypothetical protein n=2 Tax=Vibrio parahaemolyticus TaxID=670 RepID=UPI00111D52D5|nr:hypothetical protein [Vibrio parahaemolyticus]TOL65483.1 hypothetical protein CGH92_24230 [Vibrio parahaemolyticus]TOO63320.1 hypothetical protein CGH32_24255 [Vibrio parahaemolyticus]
MKLEPELLNSNFFDKNEFNAIFNAHGLYNTEQFVLRLSPKNHGLIDEILEEGFDKNNVSDDALQAYSTYLHETIHWWQHIGSTSGFILSLCYPLQAHTNVNLIKDLCALGNVKKSIKEEARIGELSGKTHTDPRQALLNSIVNNTMDFELYKRWLLKPDMSVDIFNDDYFESAGHCFNIVYSNLLPQIAEIIDPDLAIINKHDSWEDQFSKLREERVTGYYYGSPIMNRKIGIIELFEGQACFSQMQFLANLRIKGCSLEDFKTAGMLHGVYGKAFDLYIDLTGFEYPQSVLSSTVSLFLLICDLSINPVEGFPCDIEDFPNFVNHADPGIRFMFLCFAAKNLGEGICNEIKEHSKTEYLKVSYALLDVAGLKQISEGWDVITTWSDNIAGLKELMAEHQEFNFKQEYSMLRVLLSSFVSFTQDKKDSPEFFCWPGYWKTHSSVGDNVQQLWLRNLSLFSDKEHDDGIFIRHFEGKSQVNLRKTLNDFFGSNLICDLSRQWVLKDGPFSFRFKWLSESITETEWKEWADFIFEKQYGVKISSIHI